MNALANHGQRFSILILLLMFQKTIQNANYIWQVESDNHMLSESQCLEFFPGHNEEVLRVFDYYNARPLHTPPKGFTKSGYLYVKIKAEKLYILENSADHETRGQAILNQIYTAIITSPEPIPDIEFFLYIDDFDDVLEGAWIFTRKIHDYSKILIPDFGFWSWPEPKCGAYSEVRENTGRINRATSGNKIDKLFWRGAIAQNKVRESLIEMTRNKSWGDVRNINWHDQQDVELNRIEIEDHCKYTYLAHTEGLTYSGRLKYLLNCESVVVVHEMAYTQHFHHKLSPWPPKNTLDWPDVGEANIVVLDREWKKLGQVMDYLIMNPQIREKLVQNSVDTLRNKYISPAAITCYWRSLFKYWKMMTDRDRLNFGMDRWDDPREGIAWESFVLMRTTNW